MRAWSPEPIPAVHPFRKEPHVPDRPSAGDCDLRATPPRFHKAWRPEDFNKTCAPVRSSLSAPTKELQRLVVEGKLRHGGDPLLRWCASNVAAKMDAAGNYKPDRERSAHRIDPIAALVMAVDGFQRRGHEATRRSRWENSDAKLVVV